MLYLATADASVLSLSIRRTSLSVIIIDPPPYTSVVEHKCLLIHCVYASLESQLISSPGGIVITRVYWLVGWLVGSSFRCDLSKSTSPIFMKVGINVQHHKSAYLTINVCL